MSQNEKLISLNMEEIKLPDSEVEVCQKDLDEAEIKKGLQVIKLQNLVLKRILKDKIPDQKDAFQEEKTQQNIRKK